MRRALVVCTANVCRSPVVERLLQRRLDGLVGDGERWVVRSAGTVARGAVTPLHTIAAAAEFGINLSDHVARPLDRSVLAADGADLVLTMAREHLRAVVAADRDVWPRAFTLRELVRRASMVAAPAPGEELRAWLHRVAEGRRAAAMMTPDATDDVADPYGAGRREHDAMLAEVAGLVDRLVQLGPWSVGGGPSPS